MTDQSKFSLTTDSLDEVSGRALVEAWRASGLTGAAYCRTQGIRAQRLHYWRERLGYPLRVMRVAATAPAAAPQASGFVQGLVAPDAAAEKPSRSIVVGASGAAQSTAVDIVVGAAVIRVQPGFDAVLLREVIHALREA